MRQLKILILSVVIAFVSSTAMAQTKCKERDDIIDLLGKKYGETVSALGVSNTGGLVEVLNDPKDGSWTIIMTTPRGMSCLVAAGKGWRTMEQIKGEPEA